MSGLFGGGAQPAQEQPGPYDSLRIQTSTRGQPIALVYGKPRVAGNLIWYGDFQSIAHTTTQDAGGKGGGGSMSSTSYTYTCALAMAVCGNQINAISRVWRDKDVFSGTAVPLQSNNKVNEAHLVPSSGVVAVDQAAGFAGDLSVYARTGSWYESTLLSPGVDYTVSNGVYAFSSTWIGSSVSINYRYNTGGYSLDALGQLGFTFYPGDDAQTAPGYMQTYHAAQALAYRGLSYVFCGAYDLGSMASLKNHTFEVVTGSGYSAGIPDANPKDILIDLLSNPAHGGGFPAAKLTDYSNYSAYCVANGLFLSPAYIQQAPLKQLIDSIMAITNSGAVYSEGKLKIIPYGDVAASANGASYTPNVTPIYDLTDDDFLDQGAGTDPVKVTRTSPADAFNHFRVKFYDRNNNYNEEIAEAKDQANIELFGLRSAPVLDATEICDASTARAVVQILLQRGLYIRNTYEFHLSWRFCLLEPMDIVTLTDTALGMIKTPVRIIKIEEDESGDLAVTAEEYPQNVCNAALYQIQGSNGYSTNFNATAGNVNAPIIFEPPDQLVNDLEVWLAISGQTNFGGCFVWVSYDGQTFKKVGQTSGSARTGKLYADIAVGAAAVDKVNTLYVDLTESAGKLLSGTNDDALNNRTLCYVDGELLSYAAATLQATSKYALTFLNRGAYGSANASHAAGKTFARIDDAIFKMPFSINDIGRTVYLKFQGFNPFGGGVQDLPSLPIYSYALQGSALNSPLPNVANLVNNFVAGITNLHWDAVTDFRSPIDYEVRIGATWATGRVLGRTPLNSFPAVGDGTYWVAAHYRSPSGIDAYSLTPQSIVITGAVLVRNVVASSDEAATGWAGTCGDGAIRQAGNVQLAGAANLLASADFLSEPNVIWMGGVAPSGTYQIPASHQVNIGRVAPCNVIITATGYAQSIYDNFLSLSSVLDVTDLFGAALGPKIGLQPQIRLAQADGVFGPWQNFVPGSYNAQYFDARVVLTSTDQQVTAVLTGFLFTVDVPDRVDKGTNVACPAGGLTVNFSAPFNAVPNVQVTILGAQQGDYDVITTPTKGGFTVQVMNAGAGVARNINWTAQGY